MKISINISSIALCLLLLGCKQSAIQKDFYSYSKSFDLWRVPLIDPYELISPTNTGDWFLILPDPQFSNKDFYTSAKEFQLSNIESIGIQDSVIVLHSNDMYWPKLSGSYNTTLIIDAKTGDKFIYSNQHHRLDLSDKLDQLKIKSLELLATEAVVKSFQANLALPKEWR